MRGVAFSGMCLLRIREVALGPAGRDGVIWVEVEGERARPLFLGSWIGSGVSSLGGVPRAPDLSGGLAHPDVEYSLIFPTTHHMLLRSSPLSALCQGSVWLIRIGPLAGPLCAGLPEHSVSG
jgi:hypothetical protein